MEYVVFIVFLIIALIGLISLLFGLPGTLIILADAILYGWYKGFNEIETSTLIILAGLVVLGELLEFLLGIIGAKKQKASISAIAASIAGGIIGAIMGAPILFGVGAVLGAFVGAFLGAFVVELLKRKGWNQAIESGKGVFFGRVLGTISKGAIAVAMIAVVVVAVF